MSKTTKKAKEMVANQYILPVRLQGEPDFYDQLTMFYFDYLMSIACNRYRWLNLPKGCRAQMLERILNFEGVATIVKPKKNVDFWVCTKAALGGPVNIYQYPIRWKSVATGGWNVNCNALNAELIYNSYSRNINAKMMYYYAEKMADLDKSYEQLREQLQIPVIIYGPDTMQIDLIDVKNAIKNREPIIAKMKTFQDKVNIGTLYHGVEYNLDKYLTTRQMWFNEALTFLGVDNANTYKKERLIDDEVEANNDLIALRRLDGLNARREAAAYMNEKWGTDIKVVWDTDYISNNFSAENDLKVASKEGIIGEEREVSSNENGL